MSTRTRHRSGKVRHAIRGRAPSPEAQALLAKVRRLRVRTWVVAGIGIALAIAGCVALIAADGVPVLAILLPAGLAIALLAERRLARLTAVERRVRRRGAGNLTHAAAVFGWGWAYGGDDGGSGGGFDGGFDGGGGSDGGGGDGGC